MRGVYFPHQAIHSTPQLRHSIALAPSNLDQSARAREAKRNEVEGASALASSGKLVGPHDQQCPDPEVCSAVCFSATARGTQPYDGEPNLPTVVGAQGAKGPFCPWLAPDSPLPLLNLFSFRGAGCLMLRCDGTACSVFTDRRHRPLAGAVHRME
jgi:hypothetical protein